MNRTNANPRPVRDDYLALVRKFPLRVLRSDEEHGQALKAHGALAARQSPKLTAGERDYVDALASFIREYDDRGEQLPADQSTPSQRLQYLLEQSSMTPAELQEILGGSQPLVSMILGGKRQLTVDHIRALSAHFKIGPAYFM